MTFSCSINSENIKYLRTIIDTTALIVSGPQLFQFTETGLFFESMEQSGAVFVTFTVNKGFFTSYNLSKDLELKLNIDELKKILSRTLSSEEELLFDYSDSNKFSIHFNKTSGQKRNYQVPIHDLDHDDKRDIGEKARSIPLNCQIDLEPGSFKDILADVGIAADKSQKYLQIKANKSLVTFEVDRGMEGMNATVELPMSGDQNVITIDGDDTEIISNYDMDYLEKLVKLDTLTSKLNLELSSAGPLRINFIITENLEFMFLMAPLEVDDDDFDEDENDDDYKSD